MLPVPGPRPMAGGGMQPQMMGSTRVAMPSPPSIGMVGQPKPTMTGPMSSGTKPPALGGGNAPTGPAAPKAPAAPGAGGTAKSAAEWAAKLAMDTELGGPISRFTASTLGRVGGLPSLIMSGRALHNPQATPERIQSHTDTANMFAKARPDQLKDTVLRLGGTNIVDDLVWKKERHGEDLPWYKQIGGRVWNNPRTSLIGKLLGTVGTPISNVMSSLTRGSHYNPHTDTAVQFMDEPSVTEHELGHAIDFNQVTGKKPAKSMLGRFGQRLGRDAYGLAYSIPPVKLWHEGKANIESNEALEEGLADKPDELADRKARRWETLPAGYGSYIGNVAGPQFALPGMIAGKAVGMGVGAGMRNAKKRDDARKAKEQPAKEKPKQDEAEDNEPTRKAAAWAVSLVKQANPGQVPGIPTAASPPGMPGLGPNSAAQSTPLTAPKPGLKPPVSGPGPGIALPPKPPAGPGPDIAKPPLGGMPDVPPQLPGSPPAAPTAEPVPTPGSLGAAGAGGAGGLGAAAAGPAGPETSPTEGGQTEWFQHIPKMLGLDSMSPMLQKILSVGGPAVLMMLLSRMFGKQGSYTPTQVRKAGELFDRMTETQKLALSSEVIANRASIFEHVQSMVLQHTLKQAASSCVKMAPRGSRIGKGKPDGKYSLGHQYQGSMLKKADEPFNTSDFLRVPEEQRDAARTGLPSRPGEWYPGMTPRMNGQDRLELPPYPTKLPDAPPLDPGMRKIPGATTLSNLMQPGYRNQQLQMEQDAWQKQRDNLAPARFGDLKELELRQVTNQQMQSRLTGKPVPENFRPLLQSGQLDPSGVARPASAVTLPSPVKHVPPTPPPSMQSPKLGPQPTPTANASTPAASAKVAELAPAAFATKLAGTFNLAQWRAKQKIKDAKKKNEKKSAIDFLESSQEPFTPPLSAKPQELALSFGNHTFGQKLATPVGGPTPEAPTSRLTVSQDFSAPPAAPAAAMTPKPVALAPQPPQQPTANNTNRFYGGNAR